MLLPECIQLALECQSPEVVCGFTECDGWGSVDECRQSNRAIDGHTATCMIECCGQMNTIKVEDAAAIRLRLQFLMSLP